MTKFFDGTQMKDNEVEDYCLFRVRLRRDNVRAKLFYDAVVIASDCVSYFKPGSSLVNTRDGSGSYPAHLAGERIPSDETMREILLFLTYECAALHSGLAQRSIDFADSKEKRR